MNDRDNRIIVNVEMSRKGQLTMLISTVSSLARLKSSLQERLPVPSIFPHEQQADQSSLDSIQSALVAFISKEGLDSATIRDISRQAKVNRNDVTAFSPS
ncbi:MAG: hypothetical protein ABSG38_10340 [Spirochaetia bacterium]|jgi:hypothetical protein